MFVKGIFQMDTLNNIRVKHIMLLGLYAQMKNYLGCMERGYLGEMSEGEKNLIDELKATLLKIENVCWTYCEEEGRIIG